MTLPKQDECARVIRELDGDPALTQWEADFIASNRTRTVFTDPQRESVAKLLDKYDV